MAIVETMTYEYFKLDRILFEYIYMATSTVIQHGCYNFSDFSPIPIEVQ